MLFFKKNGLLHTWIDFNEMLVWECWHAASFLLLSYLWRLTSSSIPMRRMEKAQQSMPKSWHLVMSPYTRTPAYPTMRKTRWVLILNNFNTLFFPFFSHFVNINIVQLTYAHIKWIFCWIYMHTYTCFWHKMLSLYIMTLCLVSFT